MNGILICKFLKIFKKLEESLFILFCLSLWGNGSGGTYGFTGGFTSSFGWGLDSNVVRLFDRIFSCIVKNSSLLWPIFLWLSSASSLISFWYTISKDSFCTYSNCLPLFKVIACTCLFGNLSVLLDSDPCVLPESRLAICPTGTSRLYIDDAWFLIRASWF